MRQELSVKDSEEDVYSSALACKCDKKQLQGATINLGDLISADVIRPSDITIQGDILPDGGKLLVKIKYTSQN